MPQQVRVSSERDGVRIQRQQNPGDVRLPTSRQPSQDKQDLKKYENLLRELNQHTLFLLLFYITTLFIRRNYRIETYVGTPS